MEFLRIIDELGLQNSSFLQQFKGALSVLRFLTNESRLKMMKNAFYFTLKTLLVLKILKFLSRVFGHVKNGLIRKIKLISKPGMDVSRTCMAC